MDWPTGANIGEWKGEYSVQRTSVHSLIVSGEERYISVWLGDDKGWLSMVAMVLEIEYL